MVVAFRRHTLLPLDDCLYALQPSIPHLTRSALHRCLQRHGISRLPDIEGDKPKRQRFKRYPIGFFHIDIAEVQTAEGKLYLFVGIDRTSKFAVTQLVDKTDRRTAWKFLEHLRQMIEREHAGLWIATQCRLVSISRSSFYYAPTPETADKLALMAVIDASFLDHPWYGSRQMARHLCRLGHAVGRRRVRRLMAQMGLAPIYQRPRTSDPHPEHRIYPYLLRDLEITRPGHVWCADITYIPMRRGFLYLVAIMDWASRKVLAWRLPNTMDAEFCVAALRDALSRFGKPKIFNTDQGGQFTSADFTGALRDAGVRISMDGLGRWMDNVFIERLWRSLKYECVYLNAFETGSELRAGLGRWIGYYNGQRPHSRFAGRGIRAGRRDAISGACPGYGAHQTGGVNKPGNSLTQPPNCPEWRDHLRPPTPTSASSASPQQCYGYPLST